MKKKSSNFLFLVGTLLISSSIFSQKKNETSAAVAYKTTYSNALASENLSGAKKALLDAKKFIDLAADNMETKESPKTLMLKGAIYTTIYLFANDSKDTALFNLVGPTALEDAAIALKKGYNSGDKYKADIADVVNEKFQAIETISMSMYNEKKYKEAAQMYSTQAKFYDAINLLDSNSLFNSALCYDRAGDYGNAAKTFEKLAKAGYKGGSTYAMASNAYRKNKQFAESKLIISEGRNKYPQDKDVLLEAVNSCLEANDSNGAELLLTEAINKDPNNKLLHLTIGSIYIELKQNEKAEAAFNNALAIDPDYQDAQYQLGATLVNWAGSLIAQTNNLKYNDPKIKVLEKQATEIYNRAIAPLEKYITKNPNDKNVLTILSQLYRSIGNMEKSDSYKERAKAIK